MQVMGGYLTIIKAIVKCVPVCKLNQVIRLPNSMPDEKGENADSLGAPLCLSEAHSRVLLQHWIIISTKMTKYQR